MMNCALTLCELPPENLIAQFIILSSSPNCVLKSFPLLSSLLTQGGITTVNRRRLLPLLVAACLFIASLAQAEQNSSIKHVLLISVDGLHALDVANYVQRHPNSALAQLSRSGITFSNARTPANSDSFPGLMALVTGGSAVTTGLFYDVSYDRTI